MVSHPTPREPDFTLDSDEQELDPALRACLLETAPLPALAAQVRLPDELGDAGRGIVAAWMREAPEPRVGEVLDGHYTLERVLGRGGMGVVYAAKNLRTGRTVAIKRIASEQLLGSARRRDAAERMRKEARAASRIRHPNVVDLLDVGGSDEAPYLVMELLEGESLGRRIARGALSWSSAVGLLLPVLEGVGAAHAVGVIHRDLKPDNLFLCGEGEQTVPKVLDFGVAAMRSETGLEAGNLTRTGAVIGTPAYMPLEQLTGGAVDARTDLYALCVVLYQALTGQLPFRAQNASELAVQVATTSPVPPSRHVPALRGARDALLLKGLAREPAERFQTTAELAAALRHVDRSDRAARGRRIALTALALTGAALIAAGTWWSRSERAREVVPPVAAAPARDQADVELAREVSSPHERPDEGPTLDAGAPPVKTTLRRRVPRPVMAPSPVPAPVNTPQRAPQDLQVEDF